LLDVALAVLARIRKQLVGDLRNQLYLVELLSGGKQ
jgi:hypothetical protein